MKNVLAVWLLLMSGFLSAESYVSYVNITGIRAFEQNNGQLHTLLIANDMQYLVNNPDAGVPCHLWVDNKTVFDLALSALIHGHPVEISYQARGDKDKACYVHALKSMDNPDL
ncbi:MAG: hypothetical protein OXE99_02770 [Cellvibrionales bacterium]|nr:hypothetical protein [Cellvibrionales bacterium]